MSIKSSGSSAQSLFSLDSSLARLYEALYPQVKMIANAQIAKLRPGQTITPTVLSHECYLKLADVQNADFADAKHFFCTAAKCMRHYLVDLIRHKNRQKNQSPLKQTTISVIAGDADVDIEVLDVNQMIDQLARIDSALAELTELRLFGGFSWPEIADIQGVSKRQVMRQWGMAKSFFMTLLAEQQGHV